MLPSIVQIMPWTNQFQVDHDIKFVQVLDRSSGSDTGLATSAAVCAAASEISRSGDRPMAAAAPVRARAAVNSRRVMIKGVLRSGDLPEKLTSESAVELEQQISFEIKTYLQLEKETQQRLGNL